MQAGMQSTPLRSCSSRFLPELPANLPGTCSTPRTIQNALHICANCLCGPPVHLQGRRQSAIQIIVLRLSRV